MSLETKIASLVASANALTGEVSGKMGSIDARVTGFINEWGINGYTTLEVGAGKQFASIQAAWDSLVGKMLKADVKIKVSDGVYSANSIYLGNQPFAKRIRIEGNVGNPDACIIRWVADVNKYSHGFIADGAVGVNISGFRCEGSATPDHWTYRHILSDNGSVVNSDDGTMKFVGGAVGIYSAGRSAARCKNSYFAVVAAACVVENLSLANIENSTIVGAGRATLSAMPNGFQERSFAVKANQLGEVLARNCVVSDVYVGFIAERSSFIHADIARVTNADAGFIADYASVIWAQNDGAGNVAKTTNCTTGFKASRKSEIIATGGIADGCATGFYADQMSYVSNVGGAAKNCPTGYLSWAMSSIDALSTSANSTGTTTKYSPPNNSVLGNDNAMIRFS